MLSRGTINKISITIRQQQHAISRQFSSMATMKVDNNNNNEEVVKKRANSGVVITTTGSKKKKATTNRIRKLDPIVVTQLAADRLKELLQDAEGSPIGIRLGTKRRGCNGLSYTLNYVTEENKSKTDEVVMGPNNIKVFIEPMALMNVIGTTMDWEETELSTEFTFTNPNSKGECGCGESFNV